MTFDWALAKLRDGEKVYRKSKCVGYSKFVPWIAYNKKYGNGKCIWENMFGDVRLSPDDLEAKDWEVHTEDKVKRHICPEKGFRTDVPFSATICPICDGMIKR